MYYDINFEDFCNNNLNNVYNYFILYLYKREVIRINYII